MYRCLVPPVGRLSCVVFVGVLFVSHALPAFHNNFARMSNWSTLTKWIATTEPSQISLRAFLRRAAPASGVAWPAPVRTNAPAAALARGNAAAADES